MQTTNTGPRILLLAPFCLQQGDAEAIVNANFAKALLRRGYSVDILTARHQSTKYHYPLDDQSDHEELGAKCHSISLPHGHSLKNYWLHCYSYLRTGYVYEGSQWAGGALDASLELHIKKRYELTISRTSPSEIVALRLSQAFKIPWIATWNDPFPGEKYPAPYGNGAGSVLRPHKRKLLNDVAEHANWHIFPSERLQAYMQSYFPQDITSRSSVVPHVFGEYIPAATHVGYREHQKCVLTHAGALIPPRSPETFLKGVREFVRRHNVAPDRFEIQFVGCRFDTVTKLSRTLEISQFVKELPPMSYADSLRAIAKSDVAILIEADLKDGIFLPSKIVEYARCGKPILAISPRIGTASDLFFEHGGGIVADCSSPSAISECLSGIWSSWSLGRLSTEYDSTRLARLFHESTVMPLVDTIVNALLNDVDSHYRAQCG